MARTNANNSGPSPSGSTIASQIQVLDREIGRAFADFQQHSDQCRRCSHPVRAYEQGRDLCSTGRALSYSITRLLYARAGLSPQGRFQVQHRYDWEAVGELVRIIAHYNQGAYTDEICDTATAAAAAAAPIREDPATEPIYRGSRWEQDQQRRDNAALRDSPRNSHRHSLHNSPHQPHYHQQQPFGNPRVSVQDVNSGLAQADSPPQRWANGGYLDACPPQAESPSSNNSTRSVHFATSVEVRVFDNDR